MAALRSCGSNGSSTSVTTTTTTTMQRIGSNNSNSNNNLSLTLSRSRSNDSNHSVVVMPTSRKSRRTLTATTNNHHHNNGSPSHHHHHHANNNMWSFHKVMNLLKMTVSLCGVVFFGVTFLQSQDLLESNSNHIHNWNSNNLIATTKQQSWTLRNNVKYNNNILAVQQQARYEQQEPYNTRGTGRHLQQASSSNNNNDWTSWFHLGGNAATTTRHGEEQRLSIPFWDQSPLYRKRNTWKLVVAILATDCLPHYHHKHQQEENVFPTLATLQDALQTQHAQVVVYFPQLPQSLLYPQESQIMQQEYVTCQAKLRSMVDVTFANQLTSQTLVLLNGIVNPLPPRIAYHAHHQLHHAMKQLQEMKMAPAQLEPAEKKIRQRIQAEQFNLEQEYSTGLDFCYIAEYVYQLKESRQQHNGRYNHHHGNHNEDGADLLFFLTPGTRLIPQLQQDQQQQTSDNINNNLDYGWTMIQQYENFQQRLSSDLLIHRLGYMSFLQQDLWNQLPGPNTTAAEMPPRYQASLSLPTGILLERQTLYRMSMILRSLLPYHLKTTAQLLLLYCTDLLWESQILQPINATTALVNVTNVEESTFPPPMWSHDNKKKTDSDSSSSSSLSMVVPSKMYEPLVPQYQNYLQSMINNNTMIVPPWVIINNRQLGPQRNVPSTDLLQIPSAKTLPPNDQQQQQQRRKVTFVVPSSTRPNGVKNLYVTRSLNQLFPLIRRDFYNAVQRTFQATVLLVVCGNTREELEDHQKGLWEYYGPEIKEGILEIVTTNLETYPSLHNLPNNYNDNEARLRWRSKQNLDISSSFFAAKGKGDYIMLVEDDTGYRDAFTTTLKAMLEADEREELNMAPDPQVSGFVGLVTPETDYRQHVFAQVHFGFGYSGVLIHDDDALIYAVMHYVLMDEKPCDLLYLANYIQGKVLDQKWRWQLKRVLLTHLGSVSSLKGKFQPVWGVKG